MSLLLDALRRAEEARRAKEVGGTAPSADNANTVGKAGETRIASRTPPDTGARAPTAHEAPNAYRDDPAEMTESGLALEEIEYPPDVFPAAPTPIPQAVRARNTLESVGSKDATQRDTARNVFAAKQPSVQLTSDPSSRKWILPVIAVALLAISGGGWYVWKEVNRVSSPIVARAPSPTPPTTLPPAGAGTGQLGAKAQTPAAAPDKIDTKVAEAPAPPLLPPPLREAPPSKAAILSKVAPDKVLTRREALATRLRDAPVRQDPPPGLKLARSPEVPRVNPDLALAYQSLASGNHTEARRLYLKLIAVEPLNIDAHLGLATAAARLGDSAAAVQQYRQVLALDPRNGLAIMGLVALNEGIPSAALEIELRTLVGRNPEAAPLHFSLGNIYAAERRWTEAQQAYFEAFRIDPANPDYLFNLAVSLDQLRQSRLALDYYKRAADIAVKRGGGQFDRDVVAKRIKELSGDAERAN
ncbi:MAG: tetratricopeptide repeat protein [Usitatibacteraceae bacterium]